MWVSICMDIVVHFNALTGSTTRAVNNRKNLKYTKPEWLFCGFCSENPKSLVADAMFSVLLGINLSDVLSAFHHLLQWVLSRNIIP